MSFLTLPSNRFQIAQASARNDIGGQSEKGNQRFDEVNL